MKTKIYIYMTGKQFKGKDGKIYDKLWTIERKGEYVSNFGGVTVNGEFRALDTTVPMKVDKLPRGAKPVPNDKAEELYKKDSYTFGE